MSPRRWTLFARRLTLSLAFLGGLYLYLRVEVLSLPADGCSPLYGVDPGARLLLDRRPGPMVPGDALLFRGPAGALHLGRVAEPPADLESEPRATLAAGALWVVVEREDCPGLDSTTLGPIAEADQVAEVVSVLPGGEGGP